LTDLYGESRHHAQLERGLARHGATDFSYTSTDTTATIEFTLDGRRLRFTFDLPDPGEDRYIRDPVTRHRRSPHIAAERWERDVSRRSRNLTQLLEAKAAAVENGTATFEQEWGPYEVLPGDHTVRD